MNPFLRIAIVLSVSFISAGASPPGIRMAQTEVGKYSHLDAGKGTPVVVFEAGLGASKESWRWVFADVAKSTRAFAYDRAGTGDSVARSNDRSAAQIVDELHALLAAAAVSPPYVFVGHFHGALYVNLYARTYPDEVAGVVFVDALHEDFPARCKAVARRDCFPSQSSVEVNQDRFNPESGILWESQERVVPRRAGFSAAAKEYMGQSASIQQLHEAKPFPPVPVVVINGTQGGDASIRALWNDTQKELAGLSPKGRYVQCDTCTRAVHADKPTVVVEAILSVVAQARGPAR
jgi:pimeloyl-ACP methyl ester carboxylesterase